MKYVFITGASSGLGLATAKHLCKLGYSVYAGIRDVDGKNADIVKKLLEYADTTSGDITSVEIDLSSADSIKLCVEYLTELLPKLDVLINNAGLGALGLVEEFSLEQSKALFDVNFFSPVELIKQCIPLLTKSLNPKIINVTSAGGRLNFPLLGYYCASKYALEAISESLSVELNDLNIRLHIVEPGSFSTNLHKNRMMNDINHQTIYSRMEKVKLAMLSGVATATGDINKSRDPLEFSKLIAQLIHEDIKELRHVVGAVATEGIHEINEFIKPKQINLFNKFGL